jgi:putative ABC transport system permease protein
MHSFSTIGRVAWIDDSLRDLRHALRSLARTPGFTVVAILTLALGMGLNTAVFSMVNTLLLPPTPFEREWDLVGLRRTTPKNPGRFGGFSPADYFDLKRAESAFGQFAAYANVMGGVSLSEPHRAAESLPGKRVSSDYFSVMDLSPILGRGFHPNEEIVGRDGVVILSHALWQRRFAGDAAVIGHSVRLDGRTREIVGVLPAGRDSGRMTERFGAYLPLSFGSAERNDRSQRSLNIVGRRASTVSVAQGNAFVSAFGASLATDHPAENAGSTWRSESLFDVTASSSGGRMMLAMLLGLSGFVLLIACSNLANFFLARTLARTHELAVRASLGASRFQLLQPLALESLLLVIGGAGAALLVGQWGGNWLNAWTTADSPRILFPLDWRVLGYTLGAALGTTLFFGLGPALFALRLNPQRNLKQGVRGTTVGPGHRRLRHVLIIGQFAMAMVLLAGAGFLQRGGYILLQKDLGWDVDRVVQGTFDLPAARYPGDDEILAFQRGASERLAQLPGVEAVSFSHLLPVEPTGTRPYVIENGRDSATTMELSASSNAVTPAYFKTLGTQMRRGRTFTFTDIASSPHVAIISESLARACFGEENPIGRRLAEAGTALPVWLEIEGVVADVETPGFSQSAVPLHVYRPFAQQPVRSSAFAIRLSGIAPAMMLESIRSAFTALDPDLPVRDLMSAEARVAGGSDLDALKGLLSAFALLGLSLAALGIYGVIARTVAQRTSEIGIRMALGAQRWDMFRLIVGSGLRLAMIGAGLGLVGAAGLSRLIGTFMPGIQINGALVASGATIVLLTVAFAACCLPARRATTIQPILALRSE